MKSVFTFALGAAAGAAVARWIKQGNSQQWRDQAQAKASSAASTVQTQATHAASTIKGAAHAVTPSRSEQMDDATLADRVRSEIFRADDAPKGSVSVDVQAGVVYLRGEVSDPAWIDRLATDARGVTGITGVKNLLHAPGTPTPAAEPRYLASEQYRS